MRTAASVKGSPGAAGRNSIIHPFSMCLQAQGLMFTTLIRFLQGHSSLEDHIRLVSHNPLALTHKFTSCCWFYTSSPSVSLFLGGLGFCVTVLLFWYHHVFITHASHCRAVRLLASAAWSRPAVVTAAFSGLLQVTGESSFPVIIIALSSFWLARRLCDYNSSLGLLRLGGTIFMLVFLYVL